MEAKCSFCEFFGEKQHCHNCRVFNKTRTHVPQEIDCSIEEIVEYINNNEDIADKFSVGDYKMIELYTGEKVKLILLDTNKDKLADGEGYAKSTFGILTLDGLYRMNAERSNETSWKDSEMRTIRMERILRLLPEVIRNNIKPVIKHTSAGGGNREIITTTDKCFLFSEIEIRGEVEYSRSGENDQYEYFILAENRSFNGIWWLRSPCYYLSGYFCCVSSSGNSNNISAGYDCGVAFGFCI